MIMALTYLIVFFVVMVFAIAVEYVTAIPVYMLGKKHNVKYAWLVWIPFVTSYARKYVLCSVNENKEFKIFDGNFIFQNDKIPAFFNDKLVFKTRINSFWAYLVAMLLLPTVISSVIAIFAAIPFIGWLISIALSVLYLAPMLVEVAVSYTYLRDISNLYNADVKSNNVTSFIIAIVDALLTFDIAATIYLFMLLKKEPIESALEVEAKPVEE